MAGMRIGTILLLAAVLWTTALPGAAWAWLEGDFILSGSHRIWTEPVTGMEFVWIPKGCYKMGCGPWAGNCRSDEKPVHEVCVEGYWLGKHEVTQGQWKKVMSSNPSEFKKGDRYPVDTVSWTMAKEFIKKLSSKNNGRFTFRLPVEAEWEYACRSGGKGEKYAGGGDLDRIAWVGSKSGNSTHAVGTKAPNGLGLYDMSGNVEELVEDIYYWEGYSKHRRETPIDRETLLALRGGSWEDDPENLRCTARSQILGRLGHWGQSGFRLVRDE